MTMLLTFLLMLVIVAAMSIGVMAGRKPIAGSCGGVRALGMGGECAVCGGNPNACEAETKASRAASQDAGTALGVDAMAAREPGEDVRSL